MKWNSRNIKEILEFISIYKLNSTPRSNFMESMSEEINYLQNLSNSSLDSKSSSNPNIIRCSENREDWLNLEMNEEILDTELIFAQAILTFGIVELQNKDERGAIIAVDPSNFNSSDIEYKDNKKRIKRKGRDYWSDIFPKVIFNVLNSNGSVGEFNDDIAGCMDFTVFHLQIQEMVEDPQFEKVFGLHHTSLKFGNETIPWYTPVICCYDLTSKMMLAFSIPDLKYLTSYALDETQAQIFERYQVVTPRAVESRTFDRLLNLVEEDREKALNLLPQTYRNSVLHIFLQQQEE